MGVYFELLHQPAKFGRGSHQLLRCFLGITGAAGCAFRRLRYSRDVAGDLTAALRRFAYIARHLVGSRVPFFHCGGDSVRDSIDLVNHFADRGNRFYCGFGVSLNGFNLAADVFGSFGGFFGQLFYFVGDYGETFAGFPGASGLDGCIQSEQVGLLRDGCNDFDDLTDFVGRVA